MHGPMPHTLLPAVEQVAQQAAERVGVALTTTLLCPKCVQGIAVYTPLNAMGYCPAGHWESGNAAASFDPTLFAWYVVSFVCVWEYVVHHVCLVCVRVCCVCRE